MLSKVGFCTITPGHLSLSSAPGWRGLTSLKLRLLFCRLVTIISPSLRGCRRCKTKRKTKTSLHMGYCLATWHEVICSKGEYVNYISCGPTGPQNPSPVSSNPYPHQCSIPTTAKVSGVPGHYRQWRARSLLCWKGLPLSRSPCKSGLAP